MQADLPPFHGVERTVEQPVAAGDSPAWLLVRRGDHLILRRDGMPAVEAVAAPSRDTPEGRVTSAGNGGPDLLTLRTIPGRCRSSMLGEGGELAYVLLPGHTVLSGCAFPRATR